MDNREKQSNIIFCDILNSNNKNIRNNNINNINLNYLINKFLRYDRQDDQEKSKFLHCDTGVKVVGKFNMSNNNQIGKEIIDKYLEAIKNYCKLYKFDVILDDSTNDVFEFTAHKLIVGFGNPSVLEKSITIHHVYGIPYIPGQAIKGCMRNYFLNQYYDMEDRTFKDEYSIMLYKLIFGEDIENDDNYKGGVIFFDVFPILSENFRLEEDVITPHYNNYYTKNNKSKNLPTDDIKIIPNIYHILDNQKFKFCLALDKKRCDFYLKNSSIKFELSYGKLKELLINLLKDTLIEHGLGAKTSVGYGRFNIDNKKNIKKNDKKFKQKAKENSKEKITIENKLAEFKRITDNNLAKKEINNFYFQNISKLNNQQRKKLSKLMNDLIN